MLFRVWNILIVDFLKSVIILPDVSVSVNHDPYSNQLHALETDVTNRGFVIRENSWKTQFVWLFRDWLSAQASNSKEAV